MGQVSFSDCQNYLPLEPFMGSNNRTALYERQNCPIQDTFHSHKCWSTNYLKFKLGYMVAEDWISSLRILCSSQIGKVLWDGRAGGSPKSTVQKCPLERPHDRQVTHSSCRILQSPALHRELVKDKAFKKDHADKYLMERNLILSEQKLLPDK